MLNQLAENNTNLTEKFQNAEQLWFWFLYSKSIQNNFRRNSGSVKRPCEILDVEILVTKLYLSGKLSEAQLETMKKFGDKRHAPNQYIYAENKFVALWNSAMDTLKKSAKEKGWIVD